MKNMLRRLGFLILFISATEGLSQNMSMALDLAGQKPYEVLRQPKDTLLTRLLAIQKQLASDEFEGRGTGDNQKAQALIATHFERIGLRKFSDDYRSPFEFTKGIRKRQGTNMVGYIEGRTNPDHFIVIGAHYDHLGIKNGKIFNGADDNASGTSALILLAEYFSKNPPHHSMIFVAFDAEELGLYGSIHFVASPPIHLAKIRLNINMDMISRNSNNEIYVVGTHQYPEFKPLINKAAKDPSLKVSFGHDDPNDTSKDYWMDSSDNAAFFEKDIPNLTFSEEDHPDYHRATDDFENIHPDFFKKVYLLIQSSIVAIDKYLTDGNDD